MFFQIHHYFSFIYIEAFFLRQGLAIFQNASNSLFSVSQDMCHPAYLFQKHIYVLIVYVHTYIHIHTYIKHRYTHGDRIPHIPGWPQIYNVNKNNLEFLILLVLHPKGWNYRPMPQRPILFSTGNQIQDFMLAR